MLETNRNDGFCRLAELSEESICELSMALGEVLLHRYAEDTCMALEGDHVLGDARRRHRSRLPGNPLLL